jgi:antirestriction protein ArdC
MEQGVMPMGSQWKSHRYKKLPFNLSTNKTYRGMNILNLWVREMMSEYKSNGWITINQMRMIGEEEDEKINLITLPDDAPDRADNKTGQRGEPVYHADSFVPKEWKHQAEGVWRSDRSGDYAKENEIRRAYLKQVGMVFNLDQIENLPEKYQQFDELLPLNETQPEITQMTDRYGVPIKLSPDGRCFYNIKEHAIYLVHQEQFVSAEDFERVKFHELVHSTGHRTLLDRFVGERTKESHAFEELVAEIGAAFMCAQWGIPGLMVHAEYIDFYVAVLKKDDKAIFRAAAKAQAAVELLMSHLPYREANDGNPKSSSFQAASEQEQSPQGEGQPTEHGRTGGIHQVNWHHPTTDGS